MIVMRRKKITSGRCRRWNGDADDNDDEDDEDVDDDEYNEDDEDVAYSGDADDNYNDDDDSGDEDVEDGTEMHDLSGEPRALKLSTNCFQLTF